MSRSVYEHDRRQLLKLAGAGIVGAPLMGACAVMPAAESFEEADVAVIGAGFAGLNAARILKAEGVSCRVLEAQARAGGRVAGGQVAGVAVDLGGMWVSPAHTELMDLLAVYGLKTYATFLDGSGVVHFGGRRQVFLRQDASSAFSEDVLQSYGRAIEAFNEICEQINIQAPWQSAEAALWDAVTVESWVRSFSNDAVFLSAWDITVRTIVCARASDTSLLAFATYCRAGGGLALLSSADRGGAQNLLVDGGMFQLADKMAAEIAFEIKFNCPVQAIYQDQRGATLIHAGGELRVREVISTLPPTLAGRLAYEPPLTPLRDGLMQRSPMGAVIKVWIAYERPFWREAGLNGLIFSSEHAASAFFDVTPPGTHLGILAGFIDAANAVNHGRLSLDARKADVLRCVEDSFGPEAARPLDYVEADWPAEKWVRGCFGTYTGTGVLARYGPAVTAVEGRIHWAGTDTAPLWTGHIEGALRAGRTGALRAIAALRADGAVR